MAFLARVRGAEVEGFGFRAVCLQPAREADDAQLAPSVDLLLFFYRNGAYIISRSAITVSFSRSRD